MNLYKIVITGGPCAGKTTALSWIQNAFSKRGYRVLFVPETATELISGGVAPWTCGSNEEYQKCQVRLQLEKEKVFEQAARTMDAEKILIVCDRGAMDNRAYMNDTEWRHVLKALSLNELALRDNYDGVFHMVTAANGAEEAYSLSNNAARTENLEEARILDEKLLASWTGHPHLRIIDNSTDFRGKLERLIAEMVSLLGEPEPYEVERKYLIEYPDLAWLESLPNCEKLDMIQTYLISSPDVQVRIRRRGRKGNFIYYLSEKRQISGTRRVETERRLSREEYMQQLEKADPNARPIRKTRYCLAANHQYYKIDVYPEWSGQAILEVEQINAEKEPVIPEGIHLIREVTGDKRYKNYALAHEMMPEEGGQS